MKQEEQAIQLSRCKLYLVVALSLAFMCLGGVLWTTNDSLLRLLAAIYVLIPLALIAKAVTRLVRNEPGIALTPHGLTYQGALSMKKKFIPWSNIGGMTLRSDKFYTYLVLRLRHPEEHISGLPSGKRDFERSAIEFFGNTLQFNISFLGRPADKVLGMVKKSQRIHRRATTNLN